jgi:hypothetical protein
MSAPDPSPRPETAPEAEEAPGIPGFGTWRRVYVAVVLVFVADVLLLAALGRIFS